MDLEMVLNELSLQTPAPDISTARERMSELIKTLRRATASDVKRILRTNSNINSLELAPGYPVARWRNDPESDREEIRFFRTLTAKAPFWEDVAEEIKDKFDLSEGFYQGKSAMGLTFAFVSDALAVSLLSESKWDCSRLELHITYLDDNGQLIEEPVEIVHASRSVHLGERGDWIKNRTRIIVRDGRELWQRRSELFPRLEFCEQVRPQVESLNATNPMFRQVMKRLFELEEYCQSWTSGPFNQCDRGIFRRPQRK